MSYSDQDYQKLAKAIVDDFVQQAIPLEDSVIKLADDRAMNAYETRRLLEATNLNAHILLYEKQADHKYIEFDVVDPEAVCNRLFASPDPSDHADSDVDAFGKEASLRLELPDERWEKLSHSVAEKLAAEAFPVLEEPVPVDPYAGKNFHYAVQLTTKVAEELHMRARAAHMDYTDKVAALANKFTFLSAMPFPEFEKDACVMASVAPAILAKLREFNTALPVASETTTKTAETRYVVEREEHGMFREVVAAYSKALDLALGCQWYEQQARPLLQ